MNMRMSFSFLRIFLTLLFLIANLFLAEFMHAKTSDGGLISGERLEMFKQEINIRRSKMPDFAVHCAILVEPKHAKKEKDEHVFNEVGGYSFGIQGTEMQNYSCYLAFYGLNSGTKLSCEEQTSGDYFQSDRSAVKYLDSKEGFKSTNNLSFRHHGNQISVETICVARDVR